MSVDVREVGDGHGWDDFFAVAEAVYRGDPHHVPTARSAELASLERRDFRGRQRAFVAHAGGRPAARVVARLAPDLADEGGQPYGLLGFFEARDEPAAVAALFAAAVAWLRRRGAGEIVGPIDGDTWHRYRLNAGPWDEPPFLLEPYNPPHYPSLWEANGFRVLESYYTKHVDDPAAAARSLEPRYRQAVDAGYRFEPLRPRRYAAEIGRLHALALQVFRDNFLYADVDEERFRGLYAGARLFLDPDLVTFAVAPDGTDAGFLFAYPDHRRAVAALGGRRHPLALARFLWLRRKRPANVNLKSLGVVPDHRRAHLASALMQRAYRRAAEKGYARANLCLIQGLNPSGRLDAGLGRLLRRYYLYRLDSTSA